MLEAGVGGQVWTYVQVQVVAGSSVCGFVKPKGEENPGAKLDQKGQLWRQEIFVAERAFVGLSGGRDLIVSSNNPAVAQTGPRSCGEGSASSRWWGCGRGTR
jgi:hypothetical protein